MNSHTEPAIAGSYPTSMIGAVLVTPKGEIKSTNTTGIAPETFKPRASQSTAILAKEILNPLYNINIAAVTLKFAIIDDTLKAYIDLIMRNAARVNNLVNDFLEYQKVNEALVLDSALS